MGSKIPGKNNKNIKNISNNYILQETKIRETKFYKNKDAAQNV